MEPDHVDWGMSENTPAKKAQASSTPWNYFPFDCHFTWGNRKKSQRVKPRQHRLGDQLNAICIQVVQSGGTGVGTYIVMVEQQATVAIVWMVSTLQAPKTLCRPILTYRSALTVFLSWGGTEATWPDLGKKTAIICLEVLLAVFSFTGRLSPGKSQ